MSRTNSCGYTGLKNLKKSTLPSSDRWPNRLETPELRTRITIRNNQARLKKWIRDWAPPGLIRSAQRVLDHVRPAPWEYVRDGWGMDARVRGWNVACVAEMQRTKWRAYADSLKGTGPLGINHEEPEKPNSGNLRDHNTLISYAYVLALAAHERQSISLLDWGGGMGHYYLLSKAVLPGVAIDYYCHDVPLLCQAGRDALNDAHFADQRQETFSRRYDLVLASSSVWYEEKWRSLLGELAEAADPYLYVTRMIFVDHGPSYLAIQRPWSLGYRTEYLCWILNRAEFLECARVQGLELVREFLICEAPHIHRAPVQGEYRGFLFRRQECSLGALRNKISEAGGHDGKGML